MALGDYLAGEIAADFGDGLLTRREAVRRLGLLGLTVTSAGALLAACSSGNSTSRDAKTTVASATAPVAKQPGETVKFAGKSGELQAAFADAAAPKGTVLVIHENRGLTPHFFDVVGRLAASGYTALCVDLLSPEGGTASMADPAAPTAALAAAPTTRLLGDLQSGIDELLRRHPDKKVGTVGFCFGGGMVWNLLNTGETRLAAAVPFYGPAPDSPDFTKAKAAVLAIYGALDARVNATREKAETALAAAKLPHEVKVFEGADHAFFNDTGARYNAKAATDAYTDMLNWFGQYLS